MKKKNNFTEFINVDCCFVAYGYKKEEEKKTNTKKMPKIRKTEAVEALRKINGSTQLCVYASMHV